MTDMPDRSAPKRGRRLAVALAAVAGAIVLAIVAFVASFDANRYKQELVDAVRVRTGRALSIDGELSLALLPRLGLSIGPARLSGPGGRGEFAQFDSAQVGVALWPLLSRRVVVERVRLEGLKFEGVRRRDGSTNLDDLLRTAAPDGTATPGPQPAPGVAAAALTIASMQWHQATIGWRDEAAGTEWRLQQADLEAGRIANGTPGSLRLSGRCPGRPRWTPGCALRCRSTRARGASTWPTRASRRARATASRRRSKPPHWPSRKVARAVGRSALGCWSTANRASST